MADLIDCACTAATIVIVLGMMSTVGAMAWVLFVVPEE